MRIEVTQCSMCKHYSEEQYCEIWQQYITNDAFYCACGVKADRKTENSSEKPNNCEHITEDGVTCAKYPACDDCLDNPLNKVKGSERLVKGSEQTEPTCSKMEQVDKDINVRSKDETQTYLFGLHIVEVAEPQRETKTETQNSNKNSNVISVYDGVSEAVRCAMCSNPNKSDRGCDGACSYDEKLYERIMKAIAESIVKDEPQTDCETCKHYNPNHEAIACERCLDGKYSRYEPQTERSE